MEISGVFSGIFVALVVGALGRLLVPGRTNLGCLVTLMCGFVGAAIGLAIGTVADWGFWPTFLTQVALAALIVVPFASITKERP